LTSPPFWPKRTRVKHISFLFLLLFTSCHKSSKLDAVKFDSLLSTGQIDRIEVVILLSSTNILTGPDAQRYVLAFRNTNRIAKPDLTKDMVAQDVRFMSGTNTLGWLSQFDNGLWKFNEYSFELRSPPR
jgi:hypothetical protein